MVKLNKPTVEERMDAFEDMVEAEHELLLNKGHDYTAGNADADAYANFRIVSGLLVGAPITPFTVALVYFMKHVLSIITFAKSGKQESNESLKGRFNDIRNYAFILNELVPDHQQYFQEKEFFASIPSNPPGECVVPTSVEDDASYKFPPIIPPPSPPDKEWLSDTDTVVLERYLDNALRITKPPKELWEFPEPPARTQFEERGDFLTGEAKPSALIHVFGGWIPASEFDAAVKKLKDEVDAAIEADAKKELDEMLAAANEAFDCATETGDCNGCDISEMCAGEYVGTLAPEEVCCSQYCDPSCVYPCCCVACIPVCPDKVEPTRANSFNYEQWDEWKEKQRKEELKNFPKEEEEEEVEVETGYGWPWGC